jgi:hypothetical protein
MRTVTAALSGIVLVVGFGVAQGTDNRSLGGLILLLGAAYCAIQWWRCAGALPAILSIGIFAVAFAVSHPLGKVIGSWPSVIFVALVASVSAFALTRPRAGVVDA